jgi:hypothetical protein
MKIQCECGNPWFAEEVQLEDVGWILERRLVCTKCETPFVKKEPPNPFLNLYEISYQEEAFPWDQWSAGKVVEQKHPIGEVYVDHSSGITAVLCVLVEEEHIHDARIKGGKILLEYMKNEQLNTGNM